MNKDKEAVLNRYKEIMSDKKHLISREQIEVVKAITKTGNIISFTRDDEKINGEIKAMYPHIFRLTDGRTFTWIDYIIGSPQILAYLKRNYPVDNQIYDYICIPASAMPTYKREV